MENKTKEITILVGMVAAGFVAGYCTAMYRVKKAVITRHWVMLSPKG